MINSPKDKRVLQALARLNYNDDFKTVKEWLESELADMSEWNDNQLNDVLLRRGQGAALVLRAYLSIHENVESWLNRSENQNGSL